MKTNFLLIVFFVVLKSKSQTWDLVWSDEFSSEISEDWIFEIGRGDNGWGNNEYQYYRKENASIENGNLTITAKKENFQGASYTSARLKTQGLKFWRYGKIEASISIPSFTGSWPAFWMLGENITSVSWPACGEIDIMEHINTSNEIHGTMHWKDHNQQYANYGKGETVDFSGFHTYSIEWDENYIKWFFDDQQYHIASIENGINGTTEFHDNFFILLNMAIGGNWPGFIIDDSKLPAQMKIDYVRVFQKNNIISKEEPKITMKIYPNPTTKNIILHSKKGLRYSICNMIGTEIKSELILKEKSNIDLINFSPGMYIISVFKDQKQLINTEHFIVK